MTNDERRKQISILINEITATTMVLLSNGGNPGHSVEKAEALAIIKRITEKAHRGGSE